MNSKLPADEQDVLASRLLAELVAEDAFDQAIASSAHRLAALSAEALEEYHAGLTDELNPEAL